MGIKLTDAFQLVTKRKLLSTKAISSLQQQITGLQSKINKAQAKIGRIQYVLRKNDELMVELDQLSEV